MGHIHFGHTIQIKTIIVIIIILSIRKESKCFSIAGKNNNRGKKKKIKSLTTKIESGIVRAEQQCRRTEYAFIVKSKI